MSRGYLLCLKDLLHTDQSCMEFRELKCVGPHLQSQSPKIKHHRLRRLSLDVRAENSNLAKSVCALEMYQHKNSHTTYYTSRLPKNHKFLLIKGLSIYEKLSPLVGKLE